MSSSALPAGWPTENHIAGYRVVRGLGAGQRADVYLGVVPATVSASTDSSAPGETGTVQIPGDGVALKVYRAGVDPASIQRELVALALAPAPHCVRLLDVATGGDGAPVAVLQRVRRGSLATLLRERASLELGEAVTTIAPLAATLTQMHSTGITHGALSASSVHFGGAGEPVLIGFGHCRIDEAATSAARLDNNPAMAEDRARLASLALLVLEAVREGSHPMLGELTGWLVDQRSPLSGFAHELEERLFTAAPALPIEFGRVDARPAAPARAVPVTSSEPARSHPPPRGSARSAQPQQSRHPGSVAASDAGAGAATFAADGRGWMALVLGARPFAPLRARVVTELRAVRRPVWIVAAAVVCALGAALVLTGQLDASGDAAPGGPVPAPHGSQDADDAEGDIRSADPDSASSSRADATLPDDPVEALPVLLRARTRCIREVSIVCLDGVDQRDSSALSDDRALIETIIAGASDGGTTDERSTGAAGWTAGESPRLSQRLGDSALITTGVGDGSGGTASAGDSKPASVLMIRTEAGWRIRDYLFEPSAG